MKKSMFKRIIGFVAAFAIVVTMIPTMVYATTDDYKIKVTQSEIQLDTLPMGYKNAHKSGQRISVKNTGNNPIKIVPATLSDEFEFKVINGSEDEVVQPNEKIVYKVYAKEGLLEGNHNTELFFMGYDVNADPAVDPEVAAAHISLYFTVDPELPRFKITVSQEKVDFGTVAETITPQTVTVTNDSNMPLNLDILEQYSYTYEWKGGVDNPEVLPGESIDLSITPQNLSVGKNNFSLMINGYNRDIDQRHPVISQKIDIKAFFDCFKFDTDVIDFGTVTPGYEVPEAKEFTITNIGHDMVSFSVNNKVKNFDLETVSEKLNYFNPGDQETYRIAPKKDLPVGDYSFDIVFTGREIYLCAMNETESRNMKFDIKKKVTVKFTVAEEVVEPEVPEEPEVKPEQPEIKPVEKTPSNIVQTGDTSNVNTWIAVVIIALGVVLGLVVYRKKKNN